MKKLVVLSFLCFLTLNSCIIQKRFPLRVFQICNIEVDKKVEVSAKIAKTNFVEKAPLNTKLVDSNKNQKSKKQITSPVSFEYQPELQETNGLVCASLNSTIPIDNQTHRINDNSQFGSSKIPQLTDHSQLEKTELKPLSTSKAIQEQKNKTAKNPSWFIYTIALVLIGVLVRILTPKSIRKRKNKRSKMPVWKQLVIGLSVLVGTVGIFYGYLYFIWNS
jgi:hypothetical protein